MCARCFDDDDDDDDERERTFPVAKVRFPPDYPQREPVRVELVEPAGAARACVRANLLLILLLLLPLLRRAVVRGG